MDALRFDALVRSIDILAPRRAALGVLGGALVGLLTRADIEDVEAKKRKKKCKGKKKKCGKKCIPKSNCCKDSNCGPDQICKKGRCTCPEGFIPCGGECIEDFLCCTDADCGGDILTCEDRFCTCPDASEIPCDVDLCCDPDTEICNAIEGTCQAGACPTTDFCNDEELFTCGPGGCVCLTSVENVTVCTDLFGACFECTTDDECTTELGETAVCVTEGPFCDSCPDEGSFCVAVGCPSDAPERRANGRSSRVRIEKLKLGR